MMVTLLRNKSLNKKSIIHIPVRFSSGKNAGKVVQKAVSSSANHSPNHRPPAQSQLPGSSNQPFNESPSQSASQINDKQNYSHPHPKLEKTSANLKFESSRTGDFAKDLIKKNQEKEEKEREEREREEREEEENKRLEDEKRLVANEENKKLLDVYNSWDNPEKKILEGEEKAFPEKPKTELLDQIAKTTISYGKTTSPHNPELSNHFLVGEITKNNGVIVNDGSTMTSSSIVHSFGVDGKKKQDFTRKIEENKQLTSDGKSQKMSPREKRTFSPGEYKEINEAQLKNPVVAEKSRYYAAAEKEANTSFPPSMTL